MKLKTLFFLLLAVGLSLRSISQSVDWALSSNSSSFEIFYDTAVDEEAGQIYTVGCISDADGFNFIISDADGAESFSADETIKGEKEGVLLVTDLEGNSLWSAVLSSNNNDAITGVDITPDGDVIVTGYFEHGNAKLYTSSGQYSLSQNDDDDEADAFYARFSLDGELLAAESFGSDDHQIGIDIKAASNAYYVLVESDVSSSDDPSKILLKIDDSDNIEWQADIHKTASFDVDDTLSEVACLAVQDDVVYVFGSYDDLLFSYTDGAGDDHVYAWSNVETQFDFFVLAMNSDGSEKWAQGIEQGSDLTYGFGMDADCNGLYLTGSAHAGFFSPLYFPGGLFLNDFDHDNIWVAGLDLESGEANWVNALYTNGSNHKDIGFGVSAGNNGNVYVTGVHESDITADGLELTHNQGQDLFVASLDYTGEVQSMISIQSQGNDVGCAIDSYAGNKLVVAGLGGNDLVLSSGSLSSEDDNALLMTLTFPEAATYLCCALEDITLSASLDNICPGETVVINASNFQLNTTLQENSGSGWTDLVEMTSPDLDLNPMQSAAYRLVSTEGVCSFVSNEITVNVIEPIGPGPGGTNCGLKIWLRADTLINSSTGLNAEDGDFVENWFHLGAETKVAEPRDGSDQYDAVVAPVWKENVQNFHPGIEFSGTQNLVMAFEELSTVKGELTNYVVTKPTTSNANSFGVLYDFGRFPDAGIGIELDQNSAGFYVHDQTMNNPDLLLMDEAYLVKNRFIENDLLAMIINQDTVNYSSDWTGTLRSDSIVFSEEMDLDLSNGGPLTFGMQSAGYDTDLSFHGEILEFISIEGALSAFDQQKIESYLSLKYSLIEEMTTKQNLVNSNGDVIYEVEGAFQDYNHGIATACVDNTSDFVQRKAKGNQDLIALGFESDIPDDLASIVWGNNGEDYLLEESVDGIPNARINRVWKVQETGAVGNIKVVLSGTELSGVTHLVTHSTDPNITTPERLICIQTEGARRFAVLDFDSGEFFSFASLPISLASGVTEASCGLSNGSIEVTATGGTSNYTFDWSPGAVLGAGTNTISALSGGDYTLTVTDGAACSISETFTVPSIPALSVDNESILMPLCNGGSNGAVSLSISGGIGDVSVEWADGYSGTSISGLAAGVFNYEVSDESSCTLNGAVTVSEPSSIALDDFEITNVDCLENSDGSVQGTLAGGNPPYSLELRQLTETFEESFMPTSELVSGVSGDFSFANLTSGEYLLQVIDNNDCVFSHSFDLTSLDTTAPVFTCFSNQITNTDSDCSFTVPNYFDGLPIDDDCVVTTTQSPAAGTELVAGTFTIQMTATDASGNNQVCEFQLRVEDNVNPVILAPIEPFTLEANDDCEVIVPDYTSMLTATDNCAVASISQTPLPGVIRDSNFSVIINATDVNGNSSFMSLEVEIVDTIDPTFVSNIPVEFEVDDDCNYLLEDLSSFILADDNCSEATASQTTAIGSPLGAGNHTINFLIEDENGNSVTHSHDITVIDTINPTGIVEAPFIFEINDGCHWVVEDLRSNVVANDNCGIQAINQTPAIGDLLEIGTSVIDFQITDLSGNEIHLQQDISIQDLSPPVFLQKTTPEFVNSNTDCEWIVPNLTGTVEGTDNCAEVVVVQIPVPGEVLGIGEHTIEFYLYDASTNSIQVDHVINVQYDLAPSLTISTPSVFNTNSGCDYIVEDLLATVTADNTCSIANIEQTPPVGTALGTGLHTISFTVTDQFNNSATFLHEIEVIDNNAPQLDCIPEVLLDAQANCQALVPAFTLSDFNALDNCLLGTISQNPAAGTVITGSTFVNVEISDASGNSSSCVVDVRVIDNTAPVVICETITVEVEDGCHFPMPDLSLEGWYSDNCEVDQVSQNILAGTPMPVGTHNVEVRATDQAGLSTSCILQLIVEDNQGPEINCPVEVTLETQSLDCGISVDNFVSTFGVTSGSCDLDYIDQDLPEGTFINVGDQNVTFTAFDLNGNSNTCSTIVHVEDVVNPVISCPGNFILNESLDCTYQMPDLTNLPAINVDEACGFVLSQSIPVGELIEGNTNVEIFARDDSGNQSSCIITVVLEDSQAPVVVSSDNVTVEVEESCVFTLDNWNEIIEIEDCNSNLSIVGNAVLGQAFDLGDHSILLTISDEALNETLFELNLNVVDTEAPVVNCPTDVIETNLNEFCAIQSPIWEDVLSISDHCPTSINLVNTIDLGNDLFTYELEISDGTNSSFCSVSVQGIDVTPPVIVDCPDPVTVDYGSNCQFVLPDYRSSISATDACSSSENLTLTQVPPSGTVISEPTEVSIVVMDESSLSSSCSFVVTPVDSSAPEIITCASDQVLFGSACDAILPDLTDELDVVDNCMFSIEQLPAPGTILGIGEHTVTFKVSDGVNEEVTCQSIISILDSEAPIVNDISLNEYSTNENCEYILESWENYIDVFDCSDFSVAVTPEIGSVLTGNNQQVTFTVSDGENEATVMSVELNLIDDLSWSVESCPSNSELFLDSECNALLPDFTSAIEFVAGCSVDLSFLQSPLPGTIISGEQEVDVEITISGNNGEEESCSFTVEVQDNSPPEMTCEDVILPAISCSSFMPDVAEFNWADDPCTLVYYSQSIPIDDELEIGTHLLSVQAFGGGELPSTCEVQITVVDNTAPIVDCSSANPIQIESGCEYTIEDFTGDIQVEDNCLSSISIAQHFIGEVESNIGQSISAGEYIIEFIVSDGINATTCSRDLEVVNTLIPSIICIDNISIDLEEGDACSKTVEFEFPEVVNSCGTEQLVQSAGLPSGSEFPVGITQNTFDLVENDNIIATCSFEITVVDVVIPTITCPEPITSCDPIVFFELPEASDNCGTVSIEQMSELDFASGSSFPLGTTTILFKAIDAEGNWDTCELVIEIVESVIPDWETLSPTYCFNQPDINLNDLVDFPGSISWSSNVQDGVLIPSNIGVGIHQIILFSEHNGCSVELAQSVEVLPLPSIDIQSDNEVCGMQTELLATGNADSFNWEIPNGAISANVASSTLQDVLVEEEGFFSFTVNGELNGCLTSASVNVHFWEQPGIPNAGEDQQLAVTNSVLNGEFDGVGEIHWESSSDAVFIGEPSNLSTEISNLSVGWNELILFQSNGTCPVNSDTLRINVLQLEIPTGFSPNGDNVNDLFYVTGLEQYAEVQIVVFNRWGNEVYKNSDYKNDWAGLNNNGNQLEEDTYYLVLTLDNDEYKGYVVIKK